MNEHTIAVPTYNERENIDFLVEGIVSLGLDSHIIIVDDNSPEGTGQLANALATVFLPQSTFREPLAMLRLTTGLVTSTILYGAAKRSKRKLNYTLLWLASLVFLTKGGTPP